ncbi:hypothetical protein D3C83_329410 [compost metagenome]
MYAPRGSGARGIEWADVDLKYRTLIALSKLSVPKIEESLGVIHEFHNLQKVEQLTGLLS